VKVLIITAVVAAAATGMAASSSAAATAPHAAAVTGVDIDPGHADSWPTAVNDRNEVVGGHTVSDQTHGFVWRDGTVTDLGTLAGGDYSLAEAINRNGDIVGESGSYTGPGGIHAVLWHGGSVRDLGSLGGNSFATAINGNGLIVGNSEVDPSGVQFRAVMWRQGVMKVLPTLPDSYYDLPSLLDAAGDAAGYSVLPSGTPHAVLWADNTIRDLGPGRAVALNALGQVLVQGVDPQGNTYPFIWDHGRKITFPANVITATALNDRGQVAGTYLPAGGAQEHGFLWRKGVFTDLGALSPVGLNDEGEILVSSATTYGLAFVWEHGSITQLLPAVGSVAAPMAISDCGLVVGTSGGDAATAWRLP
jgi:probable HAF family extracellular repeat protein